MLRNHLFLSFTFANPRIIYPPHSSFITLFAPFETQSLTNPLQRRFPQILDMHKELVVQAGMCGVSFELELTRVFNSNSTQTRPYFRVYVKLETRTHSILIDLW